jgi:hypothetical protein
MKGARLEEDMNGDKAKGAFAGFLIAAAIFTTAANVDASIGTFQLNAEFSNIKIFIDGELADPKDVNGVTVEPFIVNGTTYLPVRAISEALGYEVNWDGETKSVYVGALPEIVRRSQDSAAAEGALAGWMSEKGEALCETLEEFFGEGAVATLTADGSKLALEITKATPDQISNEERARREEEFTRGLAGIESDYSQMLELIKADTGLKGVTMSVWHYFNGTLVYMQEVS